MKHYIRFLGVGLVLGLFTEAQLKLIAGVKPQGCIIAVFAYPVIVTVSYFVSRWLDRCRLSTWGADLWHYAATGLAGLCIEWFVLGNGPGGNANQLGMFAMWTTFCFGPRVLTRPAPEAHGMRRAFWIAFIVAGVILTVVALLLPSPQARLVTVVLALIVTYIVWSVWLDDYGVVGPRNVSSGPPIPSFTCQESRAGPNRHRLLYPFEQVS